MRGRPNKPVSVHIADGTYRPDRHGNVAQAPGAPAKPDGLDSVASAFWDRVVPELMEMSIVGTIDAHELQTMCEFWSLYRKALAAAQRDPCDKNVRCAVSDYKGRVESMMSHFGMNPQARMRLAVSGGKPKSKVSRRTRA